MLDAAPELPPDVYVESWPGGGYAVRIAGHAAPVSRHDTEEEALARAAAYERGLRSAAAERRRPAGPDQ